MPFDVNEIRTELVKGGARPTLFEVQILAPEGIPGLAPALINTPFFIEATRLPESQLGVIPVPYFGRTIKLAGDRKFNDWNVTVINDEDFKLRNAFEAWSSQLNTMRTNLRTPNTLRTMTYKPKARVTQYGKTGDTLRVYEFDGIFPAMISDIELNWGATDRIQRFNVTFAYDFWTLGTGERVTSVVTPDVLV